MGEQGILKIENISKSFSHKKILKNFSLDIYEGEILGVIGSSGSGKTTFLKTLIGFYHPENGDVKFRMTDIAKGSPQVFASIYRHGYAAKKIFGFASQSPSFYENLSVRENLSYFGSLYSLPKSVLDSNVNILIQLMDLTSAENTLGKSLSGGMQRRLDIACAMIHDPDVLILDEPTADLDPALRNHMWNLVKKINKKGTTIILASHHLSEVEAFCSRIAIVKNGELVDVDTPSRLKSKYVDSQDISIQTYPGDYLGILDLIKKSCPGVHGRVSSSGLVVQSANPNLVLKEIIAAMESLDEELIDIRVSKPGLDELFLKLTKSG